MTGHPGKAKLCSQREDQWLPKVEEGGGGASEQVEHRRLGRRSEGAVYANGEPTARCIQMHRTCHAGEDPGGNAGLQVTNGQGSEQVHTGCQRDCFSSEW